MPRPFIHRVEVVEDSPLTLLTHVTARVDGVPKVLVRADVSTAHYWVYRRLADGTVVPIGLHQQVAIDVDAAMLDTPVTHDDDPEWPSTLNVGYNFRHRIAGSAWPTGAALFELQYRFALVSGEVFFPAPIYVFSVPQRAS